MSIYSTAVIIRQAVSLWIDETLRAQFSLNKKKAYLMLARHCAISGNDIPDRQSGNFILFLIFPFSWTLLCNEQLPETCMVTLNKS